MARAADKKRPAWGRFANLGFELAAAIGGFALVGYWVGGHYGNARAGMGIGAVLGIIGGMYNLIRSGLAAFKEAEADRGKPEE